MENASACAFKGADAPAPAAAAASLAVSDTAPAGVSSVFVGAVAVAAVTASCPATFTFACLLDGVEGAPLPKVATNVAPPWAELMEEAQQFATGVVCRQHCMIQNEAWK